MPVGVCANTIGAWLLAMGKLSVEAGEPTTVSPGVIRILAAGEYVCPRLKRESQIKMWVIPVGELLRPDVGSLPPPGVASYQSLPFTVYSTVISMLSLFESNSL